MPFGRLWPVIARIAEVSGALAKLRAACALAFVQPALVGRDVEDCPVPKHIPGSVRILDDQRIAARPFRRIAPLQRRWKVGAVAREAMRNAVIAREGGASKSECHYASPSDARPTCKGSDGSWIWTPG